MKRFTIKLLTGSLLTSTLLLSGCGQTAANDTSTNTTQTKSASKQTRNTEDTIRGYVQADGKSLQAWHYSLHGGGIIAIGAGVGNTNFNIYRIDADSEVLEHTFYNVNIASDSYVTDIQALEGGAFRLTTNSAGTIEHYLFNYFNGELSYEGSQTGLNQQFHNDLDNFEWYYRDNNYVLSPQGYGAVALVQADRGESKLYLYGIEDALITREAHLFGIFSGSIENLQMLRSGLISFNVTTDYALGTDDYLGYTAHYYIEYDYFNYEITYIRP